MRVTQNTYDSTVHADPPISLRFILMSLQSYSRSNSNAGIDCAFNAIQISEHRTGNPNSRRYLISVKSPLLIACQSPGFRSLRDGFKVSMSSTSAGTLVESHACQIAES